MKGWKGMLGHSLGALLAAKLLKKGDSGGWTDVYLHIGNEGSDDLWLSLRAWRCCTKKEDLPLRLYEDRNNEDLSYLNGESSFSILRD